MFLKIIIVAVGVACALLGYPEGMIVGALLSTQLSDANIAAFDDQVKHEYQALGVLRPHVRRKTGVIGSTQRFTTYSPGIATPRVPQTDVVPMNTGPTNYTATLGDWNAPQYTDIFMQQKVNFSEQALLGHTIAAAIGRRDDQIIIDSLEAASTSLTVSNAIGGTDSNLNTAKMRQAKKLLDTKNVPMENRKLLIHANNLYGLLGDSDATTFDKNVVKALVDGDIKRWLGFDIIVLGDRDEGGLTVDGSDDRTTFAFHGGEMGAVAIAEGIAMRTTVDWIAEKTSHLANGLFSAGGTSLQANGIVEITNREA